MFSARNYPSSGLTEADCDSMLEYLNSAYNPFPHSNLTYWESSILALHDCHRVKLESQTPLVVFKSINGYTDIKKLGRTAAYAKMKTVTDFFEDKFKGCYYFNNDSFRYFITDPAVLSKLKEEAITYNNSKSVLSNCIIS